MQTEHTDLRGRAEPAQEPREERQSSGVLSQHQTATSAPSASLELPSWEFCTGKGMRGGEEIIVPRSWEENNSWGSG